MAAWTWIGRFGLAFVAVGLTDLVLAWFPLGLGRVEWEFATVAQTVASLPVVTLGFVGVLGAGLALGKRWGVLASAWAGLTFALLLFVALVLFYLSVPVALGATEGLAKTGLVKAIVKTTVLGAVFLVIYGGAGVGAIRHIKSNSGVRNA